MKNDVEFKYAGGGFEVNYNPYTTSYDHPLRQEIRINCFSSGCKTFIKTPDIQNREECDRFYRERQDAKMKAFLVKCFAEIAQKQTILFFQRCKNLVLLWKRNKQQRSGFTAPLLIKTEIKACI